MKNRQNIYKITCITLLIDQILKLIIRYNLNLNQEIKVIKNFFSIVYVENTGAAFSMFKDATIVLIIISVIFIIVLDKYIKKEEPNLNKMDIISFGLILGGINGNLLDRIIHRAVTDFLSFTIINYDYPVFNFADICIVIGAILLIISTMFKGKKDK